MIMKKYLYETHMHTSQASACSDSPGRDYIQRYMDMGYDGIIITDHFFRGNCAVDRTLPWRERINIFCSGYEDALNEGLKRGFPVFFSWEENFEGDEYLVYGLDKKWLLEHPEMEHWTRKEQFDEVHRYGGCVVQAHPFRARNYISVIHLAPYLCDGIEVLNAGNEKEWDAQAARYAFFLGKPVTAGSDNHHADRMDRDRNMAGVLLDEKLNDIRDYVRVILENRPIGLWAPREGTPWRADLPITKPLEALDRNGVPFECDIRQFLENGQWR